MAILTTVGRTALAMAIANETIHLAWGTGNPDWDTTPAAESIGDTALIAELGRHAISVLGYCSPDENGEIQVPNGRFTLSQTPTNYLFMRFAFSFGDSETGTIREVGIFIGTTFVSGLPSGQVYFLPNQIQDPGRLLALEHIPALIRSPNVRQTFEFVLTL